jgi:D-cysteine desulfhydrase
MGIRFDGIAVAVGSGGTYAGLLMAKKLLGHPARIIGINVSRDAGYFKERIAAILEESGRYLGAALSAGAGEIDIIDGYVGRGYALSSAEELRFIHELAMLEGVILDPVYTGKAMYGLANEIRSGRLRDCGNLLFIHTGGLFDIFNVKESFDFRRR